MSPIPSIRQHPETARSDAATEVKINSHNPKFFHLPNCDCSILLVGCVCMLYVTFCESQTKLTPWVVVVPCSCWVAPTPSQGVFSSSKVKVVSLIQRSFLALRSQEKRFQTGGFTSSAYKATCDATGTASSSGWTSTQWPRKTAACTKRNSPIRPSIDVENVPKTHCVQHVEKKMPTCLRRKE